MGKKNESAIKSEPSFIKPLDGSPLMSDNCWNTVLDTLRKKAETQREIKCLEWGAGNSTISLVKEGIKTNKMFTFVSIDHDTRFFPWLAESVISVFKESDNGANLKITWRPHRGTTLPVSEIKGVLKRHKTFRTSSLTWQILLANKRLQYAEQFSPNFGFSPYKIIRQLGKILFIRLAYWYWVVCRVLRALFVKDDLSLKNSPRELNLNLIGADIKKNIFFDHFIKNPIAGCLLLEQDNLKVELWHIPEIRNIFWNKGVVLDGSIIQLPDYVNIVLQGKFDVIFIDGRARVSCIKRVYYDKLLKEGGWLFVHDAYRSEMAEAFKLFTSTFAFLLGSNVTLNGQERCNTQFGFPRVEIGESLEETKSQIQQELFIYQNLHEHT